MDRRAFINKFARVSIVVSMMALVGLFIRKKKLSMYSECPAGTTCASCKDLKSCSLPRAINEENNGKG